MSVLIKDMEKPKSCYAVIDGEYEYCPFVNADDDCVLLLKKGMCTGTWEEQYSKCPLIEKPEPCEDAVSRKAVRFILPRMRFKGFDEYRVSLDLLDKLPSVTPKRKTGKWIHSDFSHEFLHCSECGRGRYFCSNFCPNCGADMRGKQNESERKGD